MKHFKTFEEFMQDTSEYIEKHKSELKRKERLKKISRVLGENVEDIEEDEPVNEPVNTINEPVNESVPKKKWFWWLLLIISPFFIVTKIM